MKHLFFITGTLLVLSCQNNTTKQPIKTVDPEITQGQRLTEQYCKSCHDLNNTHIDSIIAPPFYAVKHQYKRFSMDKADFLTSMKLYMLNPNADNTLMKPAVKRFGTMPKQHLNDADLDKIVEYIYNTDFDKPDWFDKHLEMHRKGESHEHKILTN